MDRADTSSDARDAGSSWGSSKPSPRPSKSSSKSSSAAPAGKTGIWQVKVTLSRAKPPIWRRLEVPGSIRLDVLHQVIQEAFGWWNSHLHVFETDMGLFGSPDPELSFRDERSVTLRGVAPRMGDKFKYTYDFGDDWEHMVVVEKITTAVSGVRYPRCTGGRRACPPEDCGGVWGYEEMLDVMGRPEREQPKEIVAWIMEMFPDGFDPAKFDMDEANARIARIV